jgi:hypothetical protein
MMWLYCKWALCLCLSVISTKAICQSDTIKPRVLTLPSVLIKQPNYKADSIARSIYYRELLSKRPKQLINTTTHDGFGITLSPLTYFSKAATQERRLKKRIKAREKEAYVDYIFPVERVRQLANLPPDSFQLYYYRFRPTYKLARKMDRKKLEDYIQQGLLAFSSTKRHSRVTRLLKRIYNVKH